MGCVIRSWNLVILFMVTAAVAMAYPSDDVDVRSMAEDHKAHGVDTNKLKLFEQMRKERSQPCITGEPNCFYEKFTICIVVGAQHFWSGTDGEIYVQVEFESGKQWSAYDCIGDAISGGTTQCRDVVNKYYGAQDGVAKVRIYNTSDTDGFLPIYIIVEGPGRNYKFNCNWAQECTTDHDLYTSQCHIYESTIVEVPCEHL